MNMQTGVIVVGAGPVGLLLAIELTLGGVEVLVLDRLDGPSPALKAPSVGPLGAEALERRGMGTALAAAEDRTFAAMGPAGAAMRARLTQSRGHFALLPIRSATEPERRMRWVDQQSLEAVLAQRAAALGIDVRRGCEATDLTLHADGVELGWTSSAGQGRARCSWLVGCDGGRSTIRKLAGFVVSGAPPSITMYQAVVDIDHPERLPPGATRTPKGVLINGPRPRRLGLHDYSGPPANRDAPVTREEIEHALRRISGADVRVSAVEQANRFSDVTRLVESYRNDRVLLAGDAAHVHSPLGGQGLSLGLADAANLGWKLAAVARGDKPMGFLDSYTAERLPVAQSVLANTLAQVAIMRPEPRANAMRDLLADMMTYDDVNGHIDGLMSGLATRYDLGSERDEVGRLTGDRAVDAGGVGTSLFKEMADGDGILLDTSRDRRASRLAAGFARVRPVVAEAGPSMLVRPDGCIAWVAESGEMAGLGEALERWFAPAPPRS